MEAPLLTEALPTETTDRLLSLREQWQRVLLDAVLQHSADGPAVIWSPDLPTNHAVIFAGTATFHALIHLQGQGREAFAEGVTETALAKASRP
jgi:hypothetical protein